MLEGTTKTVGEAIVKASRLADEDSRVMHVGRWKDGHGFMFAPASWGLSPAMEYLYSVAPANRHWNGTTLEETREIVKL
jgi:hypothetical protein